MSVLAAQMRERRSGSLCKFALIHVKMLKKAEQTETVQEL
jgi:hypothetical protein